jgi:hypothetical protein
MTGSMPNLSSSNCLLLDIVSSHGYARFDPTDREFRIGKHEIMNLQFVAH